MEVKKRFKTTQVGLIPEEWNVGLLERFAQVRSGVAKNANIKLSDPIRVHYLRVANVQDGYLDMSEISEIDIERVELRRFSVVENDVLMNEGGDRDKLGRGCIWSGQFTPCVHQNHVFVVRCSSKLSPNFLTAWTRSAIAKQFFVNAGSQTTNLASINKTAIGKLPVPLPTLAEQEAIAGALSDADAWIESLEQLIAKKRQIKQGTMQELLTGKRRLPGFTGKWVMKRFGDCLVENPSYGINAPGVGFDSRLPLYLRITDIDDDGNISTTNRVSVNHQDSSNYILEGNDIVFARTGASVGKTYLYRHCHGLMVYAGFLIRAKINPSLLDPEFFFAYTHTRDYWNWVRMMSMRSGQPGINGIEYAGLELNLPPTVTEQSAISEILYDQQIEITELESKLAKARRIKQAMMQELLTGRIRLVESGKLKVESEK